MYSPGVFDLLHVGHVRFLKAAKTYGTELIVGIPTDEVVEQDKGKPPVFPLSHRMEMLKALKCVDHVEPYYRLEFFTHLTYFEPDIVVVGEWGFEQRHRDLVEWTIMEGKQFVQLPRTEGISTTEIRKRIRCPHCPVS